MNGQQIYLTPMPSFDFLTDGTGGGTPPQQRARRSLMATATAVLSVAGMMSPVAFPAPFAPVSAAAAAELPAQQLVGAPAAIGAETFNAIGAVEVQAAPVAPRRVNTEQGLVDPDQLTDTKLRSPSIRPCPSPTVSDIALLPWRSSTMPRTSLPPTAPRFVLSATG